MASRTTSTSTALSSALLSAVLAVPGGCSTAEVSGVRNWGTVHEALGRGQTAPRVALGDVATPAFWAVGALSELRGEVTIADGEVWTSIGAPPSTDAESPTPRTDHGTELATNHSATILFGATVRHWRRHPVEQPVPKDRVADYLAELAKSDGLPPDEPFVFRIEGPLLDLSFHVIAGQCPIRARMHGKKVTSPPYHEQSDRMHGTIVGVYAAHGAGVFAHGGQTVHAHVIRRTPTAITGHVEALGIGAGAVIYLPRPGPDS